MDSWLNASDSEIEDIMPEKDLVTFENMQKYYSPYSDIVASYTLGEAFTTHSRDWVGLFKTGWQDVTSYEDYQWASTDSFSHLLPRRRRVIFQAPGQKVEKQLNTYQFMYVSSAKQIIGVSDLFHILDLPKESSLDFDLLEQALVDEDESDLNKDSISKTQNDGWDFANVSFSWDQFTPVAALGANKTFNIKIMKREMPFSRVENKQIIEFFNIKDSSQKNSSSWLQKIFSKTRPSVEMFSSEYDCKVMDREMPYTQSSSTKVRSVDTTSLTRSSSENSWLDDLQIINSSSIVEDFYDSSANVIGALFNEDQDGIEFNPPESPVMLDLDDVVYDSSEGCKNLFSTDDWVDLPGCEPTDNFHKTCGLPVPSSAKPSYDFPDELCLDILFHEAEDTKKEKSKSKSKHQRRRKGKRNKALVKSSKTVDVVTPDSGSNAIKEPEFTALVPYKPSKITKRNKRHRSKSSKISCEAPPKAQETVKESVEAAPQKPSLEVVPYKRTRKGKMVTFDPMMVTQPFISSPIFFPNIPASCMRPNLAVVPYIPVLPFDNRFLVKPTLPKKPEEATPKFQFSLKKQTMCRRSGLTQGCYNCKMNRKLMVTYRERCKTSQKQLEVFQKERATLQNQLNTVAAELDELKKESQKETKSVETLTTKMDELICIIPNVDVIINGLEENNGLLDLAFQSALTDNAQLRTDMSGIQDSMKNLNKQFLETESEFKSAIRAIEEKQSLAEIKSDWQTKAPKKIERLQSIVARREQLIETLQERVNNQSFQMVRNDEEIQRLRKSLAVEQQRASNAEGHLAQMKSKMDAMISRQTSSHQKPAWGQVVTAQAILKSPPAVYTVCNEVLGHETVPSLKEPVTSQTWKIYNDALKREIREGSCRTCGMKFSPFVDKRIIEEHLIYHQQFKQ